MWQVRGAWLAGGKNVPLRAGDAIQPGSLLRPANGQANDSITVLLPDGQRFLYECFTADDCARGFRVPALNRAPEPFAVDLFARIRAQLVHERNGLPEPATQAAALPRDEILAVLDDDSRIEITGLASRLPNGRYSYDLRPLTQLDPSLPSRFHHALEKSASTISLSVPSSGLYVATVFDDENRPRIDLFIAAVEPAQAERFTKSFLAAKSLIRDWNQNYGWPTHDVQWAYLESLMSSANSPSSANPAGEDASNTEPAASPEAANTMVPNVTAEPTFDPKPGILAGSVVIAMRCNTPGAVVHYTLDGSQPIATSPVYGAPIVLKSGIMTVKSFCSATGKKDSAVVSGIFRIEMAMAQPEVR